MNRFDALRAIGHRVRAWTAANGVYVGKLTEVRAEQGSPWRGVVAIDGVLEVAVHSERGSLMRRGYRPGECIEVGGTSICFSSEEGAKTYEEALLNHIEAMRKAIERDPKSPHAEALLQVGKGSQAALRAERARMRGEAWRLVAA